MEGISNQFRQRSSNSLEFGSDRSQIDDRSHVQRSRVDIRVRRLHASLSTVVDRLEKLECARDYTSRLSGVSHLRRSQSQIAKIHRQTGNVREREKKDMRMNKQGVTSSV